MSIGGVECNADRYFFGRLLNNKKLIRKERNDFEVINGVSLRNKDNFSLGIIDQDAERKVPISFSIIIDNDKTKIYKHKINFQFLILIGPIQFEHWIKNYLIIKNKNVEYFGFDNFNDFMENSKTIKPETNERFRNLIDFVIENVNNDENHISKLKKQLEYILEKKYQFNEIEFLKI